MRLPPILFIVTILLTSCGPDRHDISTPILDDSQSDLPYSSEEPNEQIGSSDPSKVFSQGQCEEKEFVRLTAAPADSSDLAYIFPMGLMTGAHVTPVDHQYYYWGDMQAPLDRYSINSPADGYVTQVEFLENDYRVIIEHSCDVYSIYIHLEQLAGPLEDLNDTVS